VIYISKHAEIVKKNIDEILATETTVDDIETKPGMLNILKKRVHQFEKDYAKENRKTNEAGSRMPSSMVKIKAKLDSMSPDENEHILRIKKILLNNMLLELSVQVSQPKN
jgi:hypothetical protein